MTIYFKGPKRKPKPIPKQGPKPQKPSGGPKPSKPKPPPKG